MNKPAQSKELSETIITLVSLIIEMVKDNPAASQSVPQRTVTVPDESKDGELPRLAFTMQETAEILGVSYITVHRLNHRGLLRSSTALRKKVFSRAEIERFLRDTN